MTHRSYDNRGLWLVLAIALLLATPGFTLAQRTKPPVPDLTRGGQRDKNHDWTLGPTGLRGWIWGWRGHTFDARQILITQVASGSPADGIFQKGDVILGVNGRPFDDDARVQFARAITAAETEAAGGKLRLIRWRAGKTRNVELQLAVMGAYSPTAPYDCAKSKRIFEQGCRAIARKGLGHVSIPNDLNALALLASGKKEYRPMLAEYAAKVAAFHTESMATWHYGYAGLFLAEYCLATKDRSVMAGLRRIALESARGQSHVGTWGHKFSRPDGILNGYGAMNQPGLILTLSMVLAREAGVHSDELDRAIAKASSFLRWYVGKGAIPYGDHEPWPDHEDNGKCSSAAVLFDMLGDAEASRFFAKMATAAYAERESGHTGNFFNVLWAMPGVSRAGQRAAAAYFKEDAWYYDLARAWDGSFTYQGTPGNWNGHAYNHWDSTGAYLLAYALPLKSLYLTGRKPCVVKPLNSAQVAEVMAAGRDYNFWTGRRSYDGKSTAELLRCLSSWSPAVQNRAASSLGRRQADVTDKLIAMLDSPDRQTRYGACKALSACGPSAAAAAPKLLALLKGPRRQDTWFGVLGVEALTRMGQTVRKTITPELLELAAHKTPIDRRAMVPRAVAKFVFRTGRRSRRSTSGLLDVLAEQDRPLFYQAVKALLANEDGHARGDVASIYNQLTADDLKVLLPDILKATRELAPSNVMFADGVRMAGLDLLSRLGIREGMALCVELIEPDRWGAGRRVTSCLKSLRRYGGHAKAVLGPLRHARQLAVKRNRRGASDPMVQSIDKAIAEIESDTHLPPIRTVAEFIQHPSVPR